MGADKGFAGGKEWRKRRRGKKGRETDKGMKGEGEELEKEGREGKGREGHTGTSFLHFQPCGERNSDKSQANFNLKILKRTAFKLLIFIADLFLIA